MMQLVCDCSLKRVACQPLICVRKELNSEDYLAEARRLNADSWVQLKTANRNIIISAVLIAFALLFAIFAP